MRWAVMGAGATGGYFGGLLARAGEDVMLVARGEHLAAILADGLRIETPDWKDTLRLPVSGDPEHFGPVDAVLFAVKGYDTAAAFTLCRPLLGPDTLLFGLQNGVENETLFTEAIGEDHVLGGSTWIECTVLAPGVVVRYGAPQRIEYGPWDGRITARHEAAHAAMLRGGADAVLSPDGRLVKWRKFLAICPMAVITTVTRSAAGAIRDCSETMDLLQSATRELVAVALAAGVDLGGEEAVQAVTTGAATLRPEFKSSMLRDLEKGRRIELESFSGSVRRLGRRYGVPTPTHDMIYATLLPAARTAMAMAPA